MLTTIRWSTSDTNLVVMKFSNCFAESESSDEFTIIISKVDGEVAKDLPWFGWGKNTFRGIRLHYLAKTLLEKVRPQSLNYVIWIF